MDSRPSRRAAAAWLGHVGSGLSAFHFALVLWLAAVALLPAVAGWKPYVITSGSMGPRIPAGAVVVAGKPPAERLGVGSVIVFSDGSGRTVTHRIADIDAAGHYRTKGDANPVADSTPVPPERVLGVGRILVPFLGLPVAWALQGRWLASFASVAATIAAGWVVWLCWRPRRDAGPAEPGTRAPTTPDTRHPEPARPRRVPAVMTGLATLVALGSTVTLTAARFTEATDQPGNRWQAAAVFAGFEPAGTGASDLPRSATSAGQTFVFTLVGALPGGATVTIDLTEPHRGPVDYRQAAQPSASVGSAVLETGQGASSQRTARIVYTAPAAGLAHDATVTVTIPSGIRTQDVAATGLPAVFARSDGGEAHTATFAVR